MLIQKGNLWDYLGKVDALCITTNGFVKSNGECVMGRGCAKEAVNRYKNISSCLGTGIHRNGNVVQQIYRDPQHRTAIVAFPVKRSKLELTASFIHNHKDYPSLIVSHMESRFIAGDTVPGWALKAELPLIATSARQLLELTDSEGWQKVVLPRMGCGAGELQWEEVKSVVDCYLDDRFTIVSY